MQNRLAKQGDFFAATAQKEKANRRFEFKFNASVTFEFEFEVLSSKFKVSGCCARELYYQSALCAP